MTRLEIATQLVEAYFYKCAYGIFNSRNVVDDEMEIVYKAGDFSFEVCYDYCYIEVFGLDNGDFELLEDYYYWLLKRYHEGII